MLRVFAPRARDGGPKRRWNCSAECDDEGRRRHFSRNATYQEEPETLTTAIRKHYAVSQDQSVGLAKSHRRALHVTRRQTAAAEVLTLDSDLLIYRRHGNKVIPPRMPQ